jgi:hypothetical protein
LSWAVKRFSILNFLSFISMINVLTFSTHSKLPSKSSSNRNKHFTLFSQCLPSLIIIKIYYLFFR